MSKYRSYLIIWLVMLLLVLVIEQHQVIGLQALASKINTTYKTKGKTLVVDSYSVGEEPTTITVVNEVLKKGEKAWLSNYLHDGQPALDLKQYQIEYHPFTKALIASELIEETAAAIPMEPNIYIKGTKVALNAFFNPKFSRYGVNCKGCSGQRSGHGNFAVGIGADVERGVRQFNGKYKKGITFEGYYIVAADRAIPFCTILKISNHNFKGEGLKPGEPFYAVVLDRGGAIKKNRLDFYIGDERYYNDFVKYSGRRKPLATIVAFGKRRSDALGQRSCSLPKLEDLKQQ